MSNDWQKLAHSRMTLLLLLVLLLVFGENVARVALSIKQYFELPDLATALSPVYVALTSAFSAAAFAVCIWGIARLNPWAPRLTIEVSTVYLLYLLLTRLAFMRSSEARETGLFHLMIPALFLAIVIGTLAWPGTRRLFAKAAVYLDWLKSEENNRKSAGTRDQRPASDY